jgi:hypothetical protein
VYVRAVHSGGSGGVYSSTSGRGPKTGRGSRHLMRVRRRKAKKKKKKKEPGNNVRCLTAKGGRIKKYKLLA